MFAMMSLTEAVPPVSFARCSRNCLEFAGLPLHELLQLHRVRLEERRQRSKIVRGGRHCRKGGSRVAQGSMMVYICGDAVQHCCHRGARATDAVEQGLGGLRRYRV